MDVSLKNVEAELDKKVASLIQLCISADARIAHEFSEIRPVHMYIRLPNWFKVDTPIGGYNPDWAIVMDDPEAPAGADPRPVLYLITETKGAIVEQRL